MIMPIADWFKEPNTGSTVVIAFATVVNLVVSIGLWTATQSAVNVTRDTFFAANRPYVGVEAFDIRRDDARKTLEISALVKNFGTAPADEADIQHEPSTNGRPIEAEGVPDKPMILFPAMRIRRTSHLGASFDAIIAGIFRCRSDRSCSIQGPTRPALRILRRLSILSKRKFDGCSWHL